MLRITSKNRTMTQTPQSQKMPSSASYLIISSMKNEASFILEWVAYHRVIGFSDFLIYTNDCDDCTVEMLERLEELGVVKHEANRVLRRGPHKSALKAARSHPRVESADWILVSDIDEFLVVKIGDGTVRSLIGSMPANTDVIPVTWRLFSHDNRIEYVDEPVMAQFTDAERSLANGGLGDRFAKSIFRRQGGMERFGIHGPKAPDDYVWRRPDGRHLGAGDNLTRPKTDFAYDVAQINHYAVGSVDSFLVKKYRGRANHWRHDLGLDYWRRHCRGGETDTFIHRWLDRTREEIDRFMADPELNRLHKEAVAWRHGKIAELRTDSRFEETRQAILELAGTSDHQGRDDSAGRPTAGRAEVTATQPAVRSRLRSLCAEMRQLMDGLSPHDEAELALDRLDDLEKGLFGRILTE